MGARRHSLVTALVAWAALAAPAHAAPGPAPGWWATRWTPADGLPVNNLSDLAQTPDGYVWIATYGGLVRFDGARFRVYDTTNAGLPSNLLTALDVAPDGRLFVASEQHDLVSWKDGVFTRHDAELPPGGVRSFFRLDGELWFGTADGLARYADGRVSRVGPRTGAEAVAAARAPDGGLWIATEKRGLLRASADGGLEPVPGLPEVTVHAVRSDARGRLWVGSEAGLFRLEAGRVEKIADRDPCGAMAVFTIDLAGPDDAWIGTTCGLFRVSADGMRPVGEPGPHAMFRSSVRSGPDGVPVLRTSFDVRIGDDVVFTSDRQVLAHLVDREGGVWVAAIGSLTRLQREPFGRLDAGAPYNAYSVLEDRDGDVWVGTADQGALRFRDGALVQRIAMDQGVPAVQAWSLAQAPDGAMWIGSFGLCRVEGERCVRVPLDADEGKQQIRALYVDRRGRLWVGGENGLFVREGGAFQRVDARAGLPSVPYCAFAEDAAGGVWAAASGAGLVRLDDDGARRFGLAEGLPTLHVRSVWPDADGGLWVGTEDRGLVYARRLGDRLLARAVRARDGLPADGVHRVLDDGLGRVWMSSNRGVFRAERADVLDFVAGRRADVPVVTYSERDGLPDREANGGVQSPDLRLRDGRLLFSTQAGVAVIDPRRVRPDPWAPAARIEHVMAGDAVFAAGPVTLAPDRRDFSIAYTAPAFRAPEALRFRYRLEGFDPGWVDGGDRRQAFYTQVGPGRYRFRVAVSNADRVWNEEGAPLEIVVTPRIYETRWFRALAALAALALAAGSVRWRFARLRARERELAGLVEQRTAELARQASAAVAAREEIARQAAALRALDEVKTRFFAHIHHELRTPLTLIAGPLDELLKDDVPDAVRPALEVMQRNTRRLRRLTDQVLDLERGDAGLRSARVRPVDLAALAGHALAPFRSVAGRALTLDAPGPVAARADPELMETVVTNLVSNAVKFTREGGRIAVSVAREGGAARLVVADDGRGIPAADVPRIFDRFYRVESAALRSGEGSGLGLALVQQLVRQQGGEVAVESRFGEGSRFTVTLPATDEAPEALPSMHHAGVEASLFVAPPVADDAADDPRPSVLVVDDNPDLLRFVGGLLSPKYAVRHAADGESGLRAARETLPDLVLADVMMPGLDGFELAGALAADPATTGVPVLLLTARSGADAEVRGLRSGAVDFLAKPFDAEVLRARVDVLLGRRARLRDALREAPSPAPSPEPETVAARVRALVLARLDDPDLDGPTVARALAMSRPTLARRLADEGAPSPAALIRTVRLERAHDLLRDGAGNVSEVAFAVGFNSLAQFSRSFKEAYGVPPSTVIPGG